MRRALLILTIIGILPIILLALLALYAPGRPLIEVLLTMYASVLVVIVILWLAKVLKTLNGIHVALIVCVALFFAMGPIIAIARGASEATMSYLIELDNDIVLIIRILLIYIGYLVLVALIGLLVLVMVGWVLTMMIAIISTAIPIVIYHKCLPQRAKDGLHYVAYVIAAATMVGVAGYIVGLLARGV